MTTLRSSHEAAQFLRLSPQTLANWRVKGDGPPFHKIGKRIVYSDADLSAWLATHRKQNSQQ